MLEWEESQPVCYHCVHVDDTVLVFDDLANSRNSIVLGMIELPLLGFFPFYI